MMARTLSYDDKAIWNLVREESWLQEPPVFHLVSVRGPVAFVWWGLRI